MAIERVPRRLAAILAADVVGYSRLIRANEEATLAALSTLRADIIDPKIAEHDGRIFKLMGDGILAEFASVVEAVRTAGEVQLALAEHAAAGTGAQRIEFRIGINLGDVVVDGDDLQGDGVNIASRLEGLAEPGGICISASVYEQVGDRIEWVFEDLGEQKVKNIDRPRAGVAVGQRGFIDRRCAKRAVVPSGKAVDRRAALRQYERPSRPGIFRRRHGGGDHYWLGPYSLANRDRPQLDLRLQRTVSRCAESWPGACAALCGGGQRPQSR